MDAVLLLACGSIEAKRGVQWIDSARVLARAWSPERLAEARKRLAAGEQAPPIEVTGCCIDRGPIFYVVADGMHRTIAHHEAGLQIKARIDDYWLLQPAAFVLRKNSLWKRVDDTSLSPCLEEVYHRPVDDDMRHILVALGVEDRDGFIRRFARRVRQLLERVLRRCRRYLINSRMPQPGV
jgi:hypothetical protein